MPQGQHAYLRRLRCGDGQAPQFGRIGNFGLGPNAVLPTSRWARTYGPMFALRLGKVTASRVCDVLALLALELAQGGVGFWQYFTDLPELLVATHMLGAALTSAAITWVVLAARSRS